MKSYLMALAVSLVIANNVGTAYGEIVNSMFGNLAVKLERVQHGMVR